MAKNKIATCVPRLLFPFGLVGLLFYVQFSQAIKISPIKFQGADLGKSIEIYENGSRASKAPENGFRGPKATSPKRVAKLYAERSEPGEGHLYIKTTPGIGSIRIHLIGKRLTGEDPKQSEIVQLVSRSNYPTLIGPISSKTSYELSFLRHDPDDHQHFLQVDQKLEIYDFELGQIMATALLQKKNPKEKGKALVHLQVNELPKWKQVIVFQIQGRKDHVDLRQGHEFDLQASIGDVVLVHKYKILG